MKIEIKKLTIDLLDDWLSFFDNEAFSDDDDWPGCYCMHFHWNAGLDSRNNWGASLDQVYRKTGKADNRGRAIRLIKNGTMQGYLGQHRAIRAHRLCGYFCAALCAKMLAIALLLLHFYS
ncbi:MAG: hypothetical protein ACOX8S_02325 [Christensenellales bacterium]|jgi:hypothetical protein